MLLALRRAFCIVLLPAAAAAAAAATSPLLIISFISPGRFYSRVRPTTLSFTPLSPRIIVFLIPLSPLFASALAYFSRRFKSLRARVRSSRLALVYSEQSAPEIYISAPGAPLIVGECIPFPFACSCCSVYTREGRDTCQVMNHIWLNYFLFFFLFLENSKRKNLEYL